MPQAATPNMGLIKPTDNGDIGVWAPLLDAMFDKIDAHDHSPGLGVKVPMATGVTVAADIPWSNGGTFYAIKDLKAIDFQPTTQASVSAFAGALFVDSGNNELSYRTTGGSIIRFTNGATFNFSAIGAIGGDYSSVGALVDYVDANDLYRFRQQTGGGVQQYARLDCGGVDLFEFKAHPTAGVPANRVRLSSPAALAASYEMTWPGALPAAKAYATIDTTGNIATGATGNRVYSIHNAVFFAPAALTVTTGVIRSLDLSTSTAVFAAPIIVNVGETLTSWTMFLSKGSASGTISASMWEISTTGAAPTQIGVTQSNSANAPGSITLGQSGLSQAISASKNYAIMFNGGGVGGDFAYGWSATCI